MHTLLRSLSRLLLLVMLATLFSPSFGGQAALGMAAHDEGMVQVADSADRHAMHDDAACDGCPDHDAAPCADAQHHCCPGHLLGHLPASLAGNIQLLPPAGSNAAVDGGQRHFSSRIPEGLERPPRLSAA